MPGEPRLVCDYGNHTGEGPLWHPDEEAVYWVDIPVGAVYRYHPASGEHSEVYRDDVLGGFTVQADGSLLLFGAGGRVETLDLDTLETETVVDGIRPDYRFNDVIADPAGRVFCGTMHGDHHRGTLYRLDTDGSLHTVEEEVHLTNGLGFTADHGTMYYTESDIHTISMYDYDEETGEVSNRRPFVEADPDEGIPDGMTVDENGHVWSARWDANCLVHYDEAGTELERVEFPAKKVSSLTFGGPDYETAYVTTAMGPGDAGKHSKEEEGPGAGALFEVDLGVAGRPEFRSRVGLD
jgi:D-xylonolactonase